MLVYNSIFLLLGLFCIELSNVDKIIITTDIDLGTC